MLLLHSGISVSAWLGLAWPGQARPELSHGYHVICTE